MYVVTEETEVGWALLNVHTSAPSSLGSFTINTLLEMFRNTTRWLFLDNLHYSPMVPPADQRELFMQALKSLGTSIASGYLQHQRSLLPATLRSSVMTPGGRVSGRNDGEFGHLVEAQRVQSVDLEIRSHLDLLHLNGLSQSGRFRLSLGSGPAVEAEALWPSRETLLGMDVADLAHWMKTHRYIFAQLEYTAPKRLEYYRASIPNGTCGFQLVTILDRGLALADNLARHPEGIFSGEEGRQELLAYWKALQEQVEDGVFREKIAQAIYYWETWTTRSPPYL